MQPCNRICYSTVHWRLNMFQVWVGTQFPLRRDYGRSPHAYVNHRLQIQLELLLMSGMPLETYWAFNERWNNKFRYQVASCWLFLLSHTAMHESMNIKFELTITFPYFPFTQASSLTILWQGQQLYFSSLHGFLDAFLIYCVSGSHVLLSILFFKIINFCSLLVMKSHV